MPSAYPTKQPTNQPTRSPSKQPSSVPSRSPTNQPSSNPTRQPSVSPTIQPSKHPTKQPSRHPTVQPSRVPSRKPSVQPSRTPTNQPLSVPSRNPSVQPSCFPTNQPIANPSKCPSNNPTAQPTYSPSAYPTGSPTTSQPTRCPTSSPTFIPSRQPTLQPSCMPIYRPTAQPSVNPSINPSQQPSLNPSCQPTGLPKSFPSSVPTKFPTCQPTLSPNDKPSGMPTRLPTSQPSSYPSKVPSHQPSQQPSAQPLSEPTRNPTNQPTRQPTLKPTVIPTRQPSYQPSSSPSRHPSSQPSRQPSRQPSSQPSRHPTTQPTRQPSNYQPSTSPSRHPSSQPSRQPLLQPSNSPSRNPTMQPSNQPQSHPTSLPSICPSKHPSTQPSRNPSKQPSSNPTKTPSISPTRQPSKQPSLLPSTIPSTQPSKFPTRQPSIQPFSFPSAQPTSLPSKQPSLQPSQNPSHLPTRQPIRMPSAQPSRNPSSSPTNQPRSLPTTQPTYSPLLRPSSQPSKIPSSVPSRQPYRLPTCQPSSSPSTQPSRQPRMTPSTQPTHIPSAQPSLQPRSLPTTQPTVQPTLQPTNQPFSIPSRLPTTSPSTQPTIQPSRSPTSQPTAQPIRDPTVQPTKQPSELPSCQPIARPSMIPSIQPSKQPTVQPTTQPSLPPTSAPTVQPTRQPNSNPTSNPSSLPSTTPSMQPRAFPSAQPSMQPVSHPTRQPSRNPSNQPTLQPNGKPSMQPTLQPITLPSSKPSSQPSSSPSHQPYAYPTSSPSILPTSNPSIQPRGLPSFAPSTSPTASPTSCPTTLPLIYPSGLPSEQPSSKPSNQPSYQPSCQPFSKPSNKPSGSPSDCPTIQPSLSPSTQPTSPPIVNPSSTPTKVPSQQPSTVPSNLPTVIPSTSPISFPTGLPSLFPTIQPNSNPTHQPTMIPSGLPSTQPSIVPTSMPSCCPTAAPFNKPSNQPTHQPSRDPTNQPVSDPSSTPSFQPSKQPSTQPSQLPISRPTSCPTIQPTASPSSSPITHPTTNPSSTPTCQPVGKPSKQPSNQPSVQPSLTPSFNPVSFPSTNPTNLPTMSPSKSPEVNPTYFPSTSPTIRPSVSPVANPSMQPSISPTNIPSMQPSAIPSYQPINHPSSNPTVNPSTWPSFQPSSEPSYQSSLRPSLQPISNPTVLPSTIPSKIPSTQPTSLPSNPSGQPTNQPSHTPTNTPTKQPTSQPSRQPSIQPSTKPTVAPITSTPTTSSPLIHGVKRTHRPTQSPSAHPSIFPTSQPSSNPTLTLESKWTESILDLSKKIKKSLVKTQESISFFELLMNNVLEIGGLMSWNTFLYSKLKTNFEINQINSIQYYAKVLYSNNFVNTTCNNISAVSMIISSLLTKSNKISSTTTVLCENKKWIISSCPSLSSIRLCIGCKPACLTNAVSNFTAFPYDCSQYGGCVHAVSVAFTPKFPVVAVRNITVLRRDKQSISILVQTSNDTNVICAAFLSRDVIMQPSTSTIVSQGYQNRTNSNTFQSILNLNGLSPASNYSIYCLTSSITGSVTDATGLHDMIISSTLCCKSIALQINQPVLFRNASFSNAINIFVQTIPKNPLTIQVVTTHINGSRLNSKYLCRFYPSVFIANDSTSTDGYSESLSVYCGSSAAFGIFEISVVGINEDEQEFSIDYTNGNKFLVNSSNHLILEPPSFKSAIMDRYGGKISVKFDRNTNQANLPISFDCSKILHFETIQHSSCQWSDSSTIEIFLSPQSNISVNSIIYYQNLNETSAAVSYFTSECPSLSYCSFKSLNYSNLIIIEAPLNPISPTVILNGPSTILTCKSFEIDYSSSIGNLGKKWTSLSINIVGTVGVATNSISDIMYNQFKTDQTKSFLIPGNLFKPKASYVISISMCNFIGGCGSTSYHFTTLKSNSSIPQIMIQGSKSLVVSNRKNLTLSTTYYQYSCLTYNIVPSNQYLISWGVFQNDVKINRFESISLNPNTFILPQFSFNVGEEFQIVVTASSTDGSVSSSSFIDVIIKSEALVACITGGSKFGIKLWDTMILDASNSYDPNIGPSYRPHDVSISYLWTCEYIGTNSRIECPIYFKNNTSSFSPLLYVTSKSLLENDIMLIRLFITKDYRTSSTKVILYPQISNSCSVSINTPIPQSFNSGNKLKLSSTILIHSVSELEWKIVDDSKLNISEISLTNPSRSFSSNGSFEQFTFDIAISRNSFIGNRLYTLQLSCHQKSKMVSFAAIDLNVNVPPISGDFSVYPLVGQALSTSFTLSSFGWISGDLPLTYSYGFVSVIDNSLNIIRSRSVIAHTSTLLPRGNEFSNYLTDTVVIVYDDYDRNSSSTETVQVYPYSGILYNLSNSLSTSSPESIRQYLGVISTALNYPNCSLSANCSALNRHSCSSVDHTCGSCYDGYIGVIGSANTLCSELSNRRKLLTVNRTCEYCAPFQSCENGTCKSLNKTCYPSCEFGNCVYKSCYSGLQVKNCAIDDDSCQAICSCDRNYFGTSCSINLSDHTKLSYIRFTLLSALYDFILIDNPSHDTLYSWIAILNSITKHPDQLTQDSLTLSNTIMVQIITAAKLIQLPYESSSDLIESIDRIQTAQAIHHLYNFSQWKQMSKSFAELLLSDLIFDQSLQYINTNMRMLITSFNLNDNVTLYEPMTGSEKIIMSKSPSRLQFGSLNATHSMQKDWTAVSLFTYKLSLFTNLSLSINQTNINSNVLELFNHYNSITNKKSKSYQFKTTITNINAIDITLKPSIHIVTTCYNRRIKLHSILCPDKVTNISVLCNGTAGYIITQCPAYEFYSSCGGISDDFTDNQCTVQSYDNITVSCLCPFPSLPLKRRNRFLLSYDNSILLPSITFSGSSHLFRYTKNDSYFLSKSGDDTPRTYVGVAIVLSTIVICGVAFVWLSVKQKNLTKNKILTKKSKSLIEPEQLS
eukprot:gene6100-8408_t